MQWWCAISNGRDWQLRKQTLRRSEAKSGRCSASP
jgi:hypothetical protein